VTQPTPIPPPHVQYPLLPAAFRGLDAVGAPTPAMVADAAPAVALEWLASFGKSHVGLAEAVLTTLTAHVEELAIVSGDSLSGVRAFVHECCDASAWQPSLSTISLGSSDPHQALLTAGDLDGIVHAMGCHPSSDRLQALGLCLVGRMCDCEERVRQAVEAGAHRLAVSAMRAHPNADPVQSHGAFALAQLASTPVRSRELATLGAVPIVLSALTARPERASLQAHGCMALANLAMGSDPQRCQSACEEGALTAVVVALNQHPCHEGVVHWGTAALLRLTQDCANRARLAIEAGALDVLRAAVDSTPITSSASTFSRTKRGSAQVERLELVDKWLSLHVRLDTTPPTKAERVWMDMVWERCCT